MSYYLFKPPLIKQDRLEIYPFFVSNTICFKISFPYVIFEWENLGKSIRNSKSYVLVYGIFVFTSSSTVSWIHLIESAVADLTLKQPVIFYSIAKIL